MREALQICGEKIIGNFFRLTETDLFGIFLQICDPIAIGMDEIILLIIKKTRSKNIKRILVITAILVSKRRYIESKHSNLSNFVS